MTIKTLRTAAAAALLFTALAGGQALAQDRGGFNDRDGRGVDSRAFDRRGDNGFDRRGDNRFDRGDRGDVRQLQVRIDTLQRVVERELRNGGVNRRVARRAIEDLNDTERQLRRAGRDGLNFRELRVLDQRIDRVEAELRRVRTGFNGWR